MELIYNNIIEMPCVFNEKIVDISGKNKEWFIMMNEILRLLNIEKGKIDRARIAAMLRIEEDEVENILAKLEQSKVIVGYRTIVNWDKTDRNIVTALIELKVTPQRGEGFDKIAERIYKYPQVTSLYLMSGAYDLAITIEGKTMQEVALFVAQKIAPMDSIISTATHFVLKKYKEEGIVFEDDEKDTRQVITL